MRAWLACATLLIAGGACAQTVSMSGSLGDKVLLMIDGKPRTVAVGNTVQGVKLISVNPDGSVVEMAGKRFPLRLGDSPVNLGGANSEGGGSRIVMTAGSGGHFFTSGGINGRAVRFMVDTGASTIAMGQAEAERIGLKYLDGQRGQASTANGVVPFYLVTLDSVRIGDVQVYNVEAVVMPADMPYTLLGNSFLTRFQMKRENDVMTLEKR